MAKKNLDDIAEELATSAGLSRKLAKIYARFVFDAITDHLANGDSVVIGSFGKFDAQVYAARKARNLATGAMMSVPAKHRIKFEMSRTLLAEFNGSKGDTPESYDE